MLSKLDSTSSILPFIEAADQNLISPFFGVASVNDLNIESQDLGVHSAVCHGSI